MFTKEVADSFGHSLSTYLLGLDRRQKTEAHAEQDNDNVAVQVDDTSQTTLKEDVQEEIESSKNIHKSMIEVESSHVPLTQTNSQRASGRTCCGTKLSDRMKAIEEAYNGNKSSPDDVPPPSACPNRDKAAEQRKKFEEIMKRNCDPKAFLEERRRSVELPTEFADTL